MRRDAWGRARHCGSLPSWIVWVTAADAAALARPRPPCCSGCQNAEVRRVAGPVPVACGGNDVAVFVDREGRRGYLLHAAFFEVGRAGCGQELPEDGVVRVQRPGEGAPRLGVEVCWVQIGQGGGAAYLRDFEPAAEYCGVGK